MPPEGVERLSHNDIMRYEEIAVVVRAAAEMGIQKVRLTGGEPLLRPGLLDLVRMISAVPGIEDISLTTNGVLLEEMAADLRDAGLRRINVSLDTLQPEKFARITRGGKIETVWRGLAAAERVGLNPIKINAVAMRGVNDDELQDLARLTIEHAWDVRFIELMPVKNQAPWGPGFPDPQKAYLSIPEIKKALESLELIPMPKTKYEGPAEDYQLNGGRGRIGFISPRSHHFCGECNRLRMTADGSFRPCLLQDIEIPFLKALRQGESVVPYIEQAIEQKPRGHELAEHHLPSQRTMRQIGG
jgi:cyclic pyranopterin phosphate synthase